MKAIWRVNEQSWDEELPKDTVDRFLAWCVELLQLAKITISRSYFSGPFQHLGLHIFGDISQGVFSPVGFLRAQVTCTSREIITKLAFDQAKARVSPMKVVTTPKLELQAALLGSRLKREICRSLTVTLDKEFMWTDCTIVLQWINSTNKHPIFIANLVSDILENTSVDQWNHVATYYNPTDVRGPDFLRTHQFPFAPNTDVVDNIKLGIVSKGQDDHSISSLAAFVTKPLREQSINIIPFDKFSFYQKLLRGTAYMLRFYHLMKVIVP